MERCKMRVCSCCGKQRPDKYFYKVKKGNGKSVPRSECKKCTLDKKRESITKNMINGLRLYLRNVSVVAKLDGI